MTELDFPDVLWKGPYTFEDHGPDGYSIYDKSGDYVMPDEIIKLLNSLNAS